MRGAGGASSPEWRNPPVALRVLPDVRRSIPFLAVSLLALSTTASGQPVSAGIIGGTSLTQDFQNRGFGSPPVITFTSTPLWWIAGGMVEMRLPWHLSVEVDGLYHDLAFTVQGLYPGQDDLLHVVTWEVPVLVKYHFPLPGFSLPRLRPFIEAGPSFRTAYNLNGALPSGHGLAAGLGVRFKRGSCESRPRFATCAGRVTSRMFSRIPFRIKPNCS